MDDDNVTKFAPMCTSEGVAGLWLAQHIPTADRTMQISLGVLIDAMLAEGMRKSKVEAIRALKETPTMGAALASLEADIIELERVIRLKNEHGVYFDVLKI